VGACLIADEGQGTGVIIEGDNVLFQGFVIRNWTKGIKLCCENSTIANNSLEENKIGIDAAGSTGVTLMWNTISSSDSVGIYIYQATDSNVLYNEFSNLEYGIVLQKSHRNNIAYNTANNCGYGYILHSSTQNQVLYNEGLYAAHKDYYLTDNSLYNTISYNTYCTIRAPASNAGVGNIKGGGCTP
jgi:parallel beta-helix repeat protein